MRDDKGSNDGKRKPNLPKTNLMALAEKRAAMRANKKSGNPNLPKTNLMAVLEKEAAMRGNKKVDYRFAFKGLEKDAAMRAEKKAGKY